MSVTRSAARRPDRRAAGRPLRDASGAAAVPMPAFLTAPRRFLPRGPLDLLLQIVIVFVAYDAYRLSRGAIDDPHAATAAFANAGHIIDLERALHLDVEHAVQRFAEGVPGLADVSAFLYINVQTTVTFSVMAYIYLRHTSAFGFVRNTFVVTWAVALVGFVLVPTAPPRLIPGLGLHDSVGLFTGVDPNARHITKFYNPYAAVPSLHVGIATLVGGAMAALAVHRPVRIAWACYPLMVTFIVMATGNHYLFDAAAGAATAGVGVAAAYGLGRLRPAAWAFRADRRAAAGDREATGDGATAGHDGAPYLGVPARDDVAPHRGDAAADRATADRGPSTDPRPALAAENRTEVSS